MNNKKTCNNNDCCKNNNKEEGKCLQKNMGCDNKKENNSCPTSFCQSFSKNGGIITDNEYEVKSELDDTIMEID